MQTQNAIVVLEALITITDNPKMTLNQAIVLLRRVTLISKVLPTSDATSPVTPAVKSPVKSRFVSVGKKPGPKPGKKKLGRPRKVAQK